MKTEELMQLGLDRKQASSILAMNGRDIERTKSANQNERLELERLRGELKEKEEMLSAFSEMDFECMKAELLDWKAKAEQAEAKALLMQDRAVIRYEADRLYRECGVKNKELMDALMDWEQVTMSEGVICGAREQLDELKDKYAYLFYSDEPMPNFSQSIAIAQEADQSEAIREAMGI